jgi:hypothetical protein
VLLPPALLPFGPLLRPCVEDYRETARLASRPWWRVLVGERLGGTLWIDRDGGVGVERNPCWLGRNRHGGALTFQEGVGCTPLPNPLRVPGKTLGLVRTAVASSFTPC